MSERECESSHLRASWFQPIEKRVSIQLSSSNMCAVTYIEAISARLGGNRYRTLRGRRLYGSFRSTGGFAEGLEIGGRQRGFYRRRRRAGAVDGLQRGRRLAACHVVVGFCDARCVCPKASLGPASKFFEDGHLGIIDTGEVSKQWSRLPAKPAVLSTNELTEIESTWQEQREKLK